MVVLDAVSQSSELIVLPHDGPNQQMDRSHWSLDFSVYIGIGKMAVKSTQHVIYKWEEECQDLELIMASG